jgi:tetratricopeptide (TPR) repeat protein
MAHLLIVLNRPQEAIQESKRALELDPSSPILTAEVGFGHTYALEFSEALACQDRALEMDPNLPIAHYNRALNLLWLDRYEEAVESFVRALELFPTMPYGRGSLAAAYAQHGREETARQMLAELVDEDSDDNPMRTFIAVVQEALGMKEEALASIRRAVQRREPLGAYISLAWMPFHSLQSSPEYQSLVKEMNGIIGR